jgi:hypothetical protein
MFPPINQQLQQQAPDSLDQTRDDLLQHNSIKSSTKKRMKKKKVKIGTFTP